MTDLIFVHIDSEFANNRASWVYAHGAAEDLCRTVSSEEGLAWDLVSLHRGEISDVPLRGVFSVRLYDRNAFLFMINPTYRLLVLATDIEGLEDACREFNDRKND